MILSSEVDERRWLQGAATRKKPVPTFGPLTLMPAFAALSAMLRAVWPVGAWPPPAPPPPVPAATVTSRVSRLFTPRDARVALPSRFSSVRQTSAAGVACELEHTEGGRGYLSSPVSSCPAEPRERRTSCEPEGTPLRSSIMALNTPREVSGCRSCRACMLGREGGGALAGLPSAVERGSWCHSVSCCTQHGRQRTDKRSGRPTGDEHAP
jgi:hypothetical protein